MVNQQGDVLLYQTLDDGDISVAEGVVAMSGGLETAAYLSLFGGNEQDDGRPKNPATWWGNALDTDRPERQARSETQHLLQSIPPIPANLRRIEDAAKRDLSWFVQVKAATSVAVIATMPAVNTVKLVIEIQAREGVSTLEYIENWRVSA